jgi:hypothetical protein
MNKKILSLATILLISFSIFMGLGTVKSQVVGSGSIDSGLVGYWRLDEGFGSIAIDDSYNGYNGIISNCLFQICKFNTGLNFTASSTNVVVTTLDNYPNGKTMITISAWIKFSFNQSAVICGWVYNSATALRIIEGQVYFNYNTVSNSSNKIISSTLQNDDKFHLVTGTYDSLLGGFLFVDGTVIGTSLIANGNLVCVDDRLAFGSYQDINSNSGQYYTGLIDDVRVYNHALSQQEITELYSGYFIDVSTDVGSLVSPNGTYSPSWNTGLYFSSLVNVGVDQFQEFVIGAKDGYVPALVYWNNIPYSTSPLWFPNNGIYGLQGNASMFVTSQFIGFPNITPSPTSNNMQTGSLANFFSNFDSLTLMMVIGVIAVFVLITSLILLTKKGRRFK